MNLALTSAVIPRQSPVAWNTGACGAGSRIDEGDIFGHEVAGEHANPFFVPGDRSNFFHDILPDDIARHQIPHGSLHESFGDHSFMFVPPPLSNNLVPKPSGPVRDTSAEVNRMYHAVAVSDPAARRIRGAEDGWLLIGEVRVPLNTSRRPV